MNGTESFFRSYIIKKYALLFYGILSLIRVHFAQQYSTPVRILTFCFFKTIDSTHKTFEVIHRYYKTEILLTLLKELKHIRPVWLSSGAISETHTHKIIKG